MIGLARPMPVPSGQSQMLTERARRWTRIRGRNQPGKDPGLAGRQARQVSKEQARPLPLLALSPTGVPETPGRSQSKNIKRRFPEIHNLQIHKV